MNIKMDILHKLLSYGADPSKALTSGNLKGDMPLTIAAATGNTIAIDVLLNAGVNPNTPITTSNEMEGMTPIAMTAFFGQEDALKLLISRGVNFNTPIATGERQGITPIIIAVIKRNMAIIRILVAVGVDINKPLQNGRHKGLTPKLLSIPWGMLAQLDALPPPNIIQNAVTQFKNEIDATKVLIGHLPQNATTEETLTILKQALNFAVIDSTLKVFNNLIKANKIAPTILKRLLDIPQQISETTVIGTPIESLNNLEPSQKLKLLAWLISENNASYNSKI